MKHKKILLIGTIIITVCIVGIFNVFAHSGRTDGSGGHRDNKNVSGLGYYHYHCGGHPAHLHSGGVCPYTTKVYSASKPVRTPSPTPAPTPDRYKQGYDDGYEEGYDEGFDVGSTNGYGIGYDEGYDDGFGKIIGVSVVFIFLIILVIVIAVTKRRKE